MAPQQFDGSSNGSPECVRVRIWQVAVVCCFLCSGELRSENWPSFRNGLARTGSTVESISPESQPRWVYRTAAAPHMAWSSAEGRVIEDKLIGHLVKYDDAIHPVVVDGRVFFGSSVDHHLHCLELATGREIWTFGTGGPIRLAPSVDQQRVYFGSDDGFAYCLSAETGTMIWRVSASPSNEYLLARGEMISRWPVRTSVLVDSGVAYFGSGIFPHENIYLFAVNAADGTPVWKQDNISEQDAGRNDLSPQGYLLASDSLLFVPSGRSLPAAIDRKTGQLIHKRTFSWRTVAGGVVGGVQALLSDGQLYASGPHHWLAMEQQTGDVGFGWFAGRQLVVAGEQAYVATGAVVARLNRNAYAVNSRRRHELEMLVYETTRKLSGAGDKAEEYQTQIAEAQDELKRIADTGIDWQVQTTDDSSLLAAGSQIFLGGKGTVKSLSADSGDQTWQCSVEGEARGLVVAGGHLLVSTNAGGIYVFADQKTPAAAASPPAEFVENPFPEDADSATYRQAADEILRHSGVDRGFCLVVGNEQGRLAYELAKRSQLQILAIESDIEKVRAAQQQLRSAGLYGHRIVVHQSDGLTIPYSNYFANLIVSDTHLKTRQLPPSAESIGRFLKPLGGKLILGRTGADVQSAEEFQTLLSWMDSTGLKTQSTFRSEGSWNILTRGALPGAGNWSHQYGSPTNTAVSRDTRLKTDLGVLWYGDPGPGDMVNRHEGAVGPLSTNGRLFVQGETTILAYDAYNGLFLWKYENPEAIRTGVFQNQNPANLAATDDRLFHFVREQCFELDAATGVLVRVHRLPPALDDGQYQWGYVAVQNNMLFGAATARKEVELRERRRGRRTEDSTDGIFAISLESGEHIWHYQGKSISHHTIAVSSETVYFVDSSITPEQREERLRQDKSQLEALTGAARELAEERAKAADVRRVVALEARSGRQLWAESVDVTDCSDIGAGGGKLTLMFHDGVLLLGGANANGHYWKQFVAGEFDRRRLVALSAADGYKLWSKDANYKGRPIVVGRRVLAEPWSFDLHTGEQEMRKHPLTGEQVPWSLMRTGHHCGMLTGCDSGMLLFRSGDTAFYDLESDTGTRHFAGHRLGCWINAIPANGLIMIPEASAGCVCQFSIASTIVMEPRESRRDWTILSAVGAKTPVRRMFLNLGAPGDRRDPDGNIWLSFPRRTAYKETSLDVALDLQPIFFPNGRFTAVSEISMPVSGTNRPWIYTSWAEGLQKLTLPLLGPNDPPASYHLKLHFASGTDVADTAAESELIFDIRVQDKLVLKDIVLPSPEAGNSVAEIRDVRDIAVTDNLVLELVPRQGIPRLNAIEVLRSDADEEATVSRSDVSAKKD